MKVYEIKEILDAEVICGEDFLDRDVYTACGSDMMSDVLAYVKEQAVLLSGLVNPQVVRTAEMMDMKAIILVRGKTPYEEVIKLATDSVDYINPMDIQLSHKNDKEALKIKSDFIITLCDLIAGGKDGLENDEKGIIDELTQLNRQIESIILNK